MRVHAHVNTSDNSLNYAYAHARMTLDLIALTQNKRREIIFDAPLLLHPNDTLSSRTHKDCSGLNEVQKNIR